MELQIPNTCDSFIETIGCCWHFQSDTKETEGGRETMVSSVNTGECKAFCRLVTHHGSLQKPKKIDVVHVHVEVAAERFFSGKKPDPSSTLEEISARLSATLKDRQFETSTITAGFRIPAQQMAAGSALSALFGSSSRLVSEHQVILTQGTLSIIESGASEEQFDTLRFELAIYDGKAYALITVKGHGEDVFSINCLERAAVRLTAIFNKLVLAKEEAEPNEDLFNG